MFRAERSPSFRKGEELLDCESGNEEPGEAEGAHDNTSDCLGEMTPLYLERENSGEHSELHHEESVDGYNGQDVDALH